MSVLRKFEVGSYISFHMRYVQQDLGGSIVIIHDRALDDIFRMQSIVGHLLYLVGGLRFFGHDAGSEVVLLIAQWYNNS